MLHKVTSSQKCQAAAHHCRLRTNGMMSLSEEANAGEGNIAEHFRHCNDLHHVSVSPSVTPNAGTVDPDAVLKSTAAHYQWERRVDLIRHLAQMPVDDISTSATVGPAALHAPEWTCWLAACLADALSQMACHSTHPRRNACLSRVRCGHMHQRG